MWVVCAVYAYQNSPKFGRSALLWGIATLILGPIAVRILYVLPKRQPVVHAAHQKHTDPRDSLYEVPKKKR